MAPRVRDARYNPSAVFFLRRKPDPPFAFRDDLLAADRLRDGDLQLVGPAPEHLDDFVRSAGHDGNKVSVAGVKVLIDVAPGGRERCDPRQDRSGVVATYRMWMKLANESPLPFAGRVTLRIGHSKTLDRYLGHVGYEVFPSCRGRRFAERGVRLLLPLARAHAIDPVWITCNPDNAPSRRTCERLGATLIDTVDVPRRHPLRRYGHIRKCRYRLPLS